MRLDFNNIIPDALYSVGMAKRLLGIGQTTIYEYMKKKPPVLPYRMSENGWHRLILGQRHNIAERESEGQAWPEKERPVGFS